MISVRALCYEQTTEGTMVEHGGAVLHWGVISKYNGSPQDGLKQETSNLHF